MDNSISPNGILFSNNDIYSTTTAEANNDKDNSSENLSEYFNSSSHNYNYDDMKYDFDFTSLLTNDSFKVTNTDGKTTIQYFESDAIAKTTEITEKGVSLKDISIVNSNGDEISVNTFLKFAKINSSQDYKFTTGNQYSVSIEQQNGKLYAVSSKGSLEQNYIISQDEYGYYEINGNKYKTLDEVASVINDIVIPEACDADGKFGVSKQALNGLDCGLLSAINTLNYSDYGREMLNKAVTYNEDGSMSVCLAGLNRTYNITKDALETTPKLPIGDYELKALDCACRMAAQDILAGNIRISPDAPYWCNNASINDGNLVNGFYPQTIFYFLTGKDCSGEFEPDRFSRILHLDSLELNDDIFLCAASGYHTDGYFEYANVPRGNSYVPGKSVPDAFGNYVSIPDMHSYAIKDVNTKTNGTRVVTIVNPWDSSDEIVLDERTYLDLFDIIYSASDVKNDSFMPAYFY